MPFGESVGSGSEVGRRSPQIQSEPQPRQQQEREQEQGRRQRHITWADDPPVRPSDTPLHQRRSPDVSDQDILPWPFHCPSPRICGRTPVHEATIQAAIATAAPAIESIGQTSTAQRRRRAPSPFPRRQLRSRLLLSLSWMREASDRNNNDENGDTNIAEPENSEGDAASQRRSSVSSTASSLWALGWVPPSLLLRPQCRSRASSSAQESPSLSKSELVCDKEPESEPASRLESQSSTSSDLGHGSEPEAALQQTIASIGGEPDAFEMLQQTLGVDIASSPALLIDTISRRSSSNVQGWARGTNNIAQEDSQAGCSGYGDDVLAECTYSQTSGENGANARGDEHEASLDMDLDDFAPLERVRARAW